MTNTLTIHGTRKVVVGVSTALAWWSAGTLAEVPPTDASLQEIVVTATRREESISKVPLSIVAYSEQSLERAGIKGIEEIAALTPGVQFDQNTAYGNTNIAVRGISSVNGASTTGIYLGDVALQSRVTSLTVVGNPLRVAFDLDRVEVLRGPQGTLFGAGAEGGALRFIQKAPSVDKFDSVAGVELSSPQDGGASYEAHGAIGGPLKEGKVGFRVGGYYRRDGGSVDRVDFLTGKPVDRNADRSSTVAARAALTFRIGDASTITPEFYYQQRRANDTGVFTLYRSDVSAGDFNNARLLRQWSEDRFVVGSIKFEANTRWGELTSVTAYFDRRARTLSDATNLWGATCFGVSDPVNFDCSNPANNLGYGSPLGAAYPITYADAAPTLSPLDQRSFSQEVRLASADRDSRFKWVVGAYFSDTKQHDGYLSQSDTAAKYLAGYGLGPDAISTDAARRYGLDVDSLILSTEITHKEHQYALFGQEEWAFTERLKLAVGIRMSSLKLDFRVLTGGAAYFGLATPVVDGSKTEHPISPRMSVSYQVNDDNLLYATVSKGYRAGQGNIPILDSCNFQVPKAASSDSLWSYEVGSKNRLLDGRVQLDSSVFQIEWKNIQTLVTLPCGFTPVLNAGQLRSRGFDLAARVQLTKSISAAALVGYTSAKYTKDVVADVNKIVSDGDVVGNLPQVPSPWAFTLSTQYETAISSEASLFVRLEDSMRTRNSGPFAAQDPTNVTYNTNARPDPGYNVLDLRVGFSGARWSADVFANNLLDRRPLLGQFYDSGTSNFLIGRTLRPRTIGISFTLRQ